MGTYTDYEQRLLDQQSGEEMDRLEQQRERREARGTIATAPIGPAHVFADADNNGLNACVLLAPCSNEQIEQLIAEYQLAIDVRSHHTPLGRIDRIKQRCEETIAALRELQERRIEVEKYKAWAASCAPTSPETTAPRPTEQQLKITGLGWFCVFDAGEWIATFKLTDEQMAQWRIMRPKDNG